MSASRPRILGVITARGGSKGVPRKNIRELGGKPLIAWTIEAAVSAKVLDRVILSTDDAEIADIGRGLGADIPFIRPAALATDTSHHPDVMRHAVEAMKASFGEVYDVVVCLQPTVPFRRGWHIDEAGERFLASDADSLISVKRQDYPPWWMFELADDRLRPAIPFGAGVNVFNLERQEFPNVYRPNGAVYFTWTKYLLSSGALVNMDNCAYYEMENTYSVDIDSEEDFALAETLLNMNDKLQVPFFEREQEEK